MWRTFGSWRAPEPVLSSFIASSATMSYTPYLEPKKRAMWMRELYDLRDHIINTQMNLSMDSESGGSTTDSGSKRSIITIASSSSGGIGLFVRRLKKTKARLAAASQSAPLSTTDGIAVRRSPSMSCHFAVACDRAAALLLPTRRFHHNAVRTSTSTFTSSPIIIDNNNTCSTNSAAAFLLSRAHVHGDATSSHQESVQSEVRRPATQNQTTFAGNTSARHHNDVAVFDSNGRRIELRSSPSFTSVNEQPRPSSAFILRRDANEKKTGIPAVDLSSSLTAGMMRTTTETGSQEASPIRSKQNQQKLGGATKDSTTLFMNPYSEKLTSLTSSTARELERLGFVVDPNNTLRLIFTPVNAHHEDTTHASTTNTNTNTNSGSIEDASGEGSDSSLNDGNSASAPAIPEELLERLKSSKLQWKQKLWNVLNTTGGKADLIQADLNERYRTLTTAHTPPRLSVFNDPLISTLELTTDQQNVVSLVLQGFSVFIGGSAGTGKTVLVKEIHRQLVSRGLRVAMTATTGVAAVQLGGCTFHSAFGVPVVGDRRWDAAALRSLDAVIIDEVSLLDAELLNTLDSEARRSRIDPRPFGGLQLIMCGDFLQLSPGDEDLAVFCYASPLFNHLVQVKLVTPMRQKKDDPLYLLLTKLREGVFDNAAFAKLASNQSKAANEGVSVEDDDTTYIFPKRQNAIEMNEKRLGALDTEERTFLPQQGGLTLTGTFTPSIEVGFANEVVASEQINMAMVRELEALEIPEVHHTDIVVMPRRGCRGVFLLRLRLDRIAGMQKNGKMSSSAGGGGASMSATVWAQKWDAAVRSAAAKLGGRVIGTHSEEPLSAVPFSVVRNIETALQGGSGSGGSSNEAVQSLRLKIGCRVMVNRNLSRTVSNGSVGVVESFKKPNPSMFPTREENGRMISNRVPMMQKLFTELPVVRLLSGEVIQVPPITQTSGGTAATYFYGREIYSLPLQLGYAFTVHKVQGLTLDGKVVLDCKEFFSCPHLIYVACSRVRRFDQLTVRNTHQRMVIVRRSALEFSQQLRDASLLMSNNNNTNGSGNGSGSDLSDYAHKPRASWYEKYRNSMDVNGNTSLSSESSTTNNNNNNMTREVREEEEEEQ